MQGLNILRSLVLGGAMAFGSAISGARKLVDSVPLVSVDRHRGKGQGKSRVRPRSFWYRPTVTSSRKTRNPADPAQAYLIARAEAKRTRRAEKLNDCMYLALLKNPTLTAAACSRYFA